MSQENDIPVTHPILCDPMPKIMTPEEELMVYAAAGRLEEGRKLYAAFADRLEQRGSGAAQYIRDLLERPDFAIKSEDGALKHD